MTETLTAAVLAGLDDAQTLTEWFATTPTPAKVIAVTDWSDLSMLPDLPAGDVHIFVNPHEDRDQWHAIKSLCDTLTRTGRTPRLIETSIPLSLILGETTTWQTLTEGALSKPSGRAPAADKGAAKAAVTGDVKSLTSVGRTVRTAMVPHPATGELVEQQETVLPWAAWEVAAAQVGRVASVTMEVSYQTEDNGTRRVLLDDIESSTIESFAWLDHSAETRKLPRPPQALCRSVANAIRLADGPNGEVSRQRTGQESMGWVERDGRAAYVKTDAGVTADGLDDSVFGGDAEASPAYAWEEEPSVTDQRAAMRAVLIDMPKTMADADIWYMLMGQHGRAMCPGAPRTPLVLYGGQNSGKTFAAKSAGGFIGADLVRNSQVENFSATTVALEMIARQFETGVCLLDDIPPVTDARQAQELPAVIDELLRVAFAEGSLKSRGTVRNGGVGLAKNRRVHPAVLITTEESPALLVPKASARSRSCFVEIVKGKQWASKSSSEEFGRLAERWTPAAGFAYAQWVASEIDKTGGIRRYTAALSDRINAIAAEVREAHPDWQERAAVVCASFMVGLLHFADAAVTIGAVTEAEHAEITGAGEEAIDRLMAAHVDRWLGETDGLELLAEIHVQIRGLAATVGDTCIHGAPIGGCAYGCLKVRSIGRGHRHDGIDYVALVPADVAAVVSSPQRRLTKDHVKRRLLEIDGAIGKRVRVFGGQREYCVLVPEATLFPDGVMTTNREESA